MKFTFVNIKILAMCEFGRNFESSNKNKVSKPIKLHHYGKR